MPEMSATTKSNWALKSTPAVVYRVVEYLQLAVIAKENARIARKAVINIKTANWPQGVDRMHSVKIQQQHYQPRPLRPLLPKSASQMRPESFLLKRTFTDKDPINFADIANVGITVKATRELDRRSRGQRSRREREGKENTSSRNILDQNWPIHADPLLNGPDDSGNLLPPLKDYCGRMDVTMFNHKLKLDDEELRKERSGWKETQTAIPHKLWIKHWTRNMQ
ncbi:hypothetical protein B0H19DRAFT_1232488 [Mycena capillaripes]|nr:hypothetical protein B0H19DRAFT_1232488 [Mycena capillaripes]